MRRFGEVLLQIYLFIALFYGVVGLTDVLTQVLNWNQTWFSSFVGIFGLILFLATFFFVALFRTYRVPHFYYILPLFYVVTYVILGGAATLVYLKGFNEAGVRAFFLTASFLSSGFETIFAGTCLGKLSALKKNVKKGKEKLVL